MRNMRWLASILIFAIASFSFTTATRTVAQTTPQLIMDPLADTLPEGTSITVRVRLSTAPGGSVIVGLGTTDTQFCVIGPNVTLDDSNWEAGVESTVSYPENNLPQSNGTCEIIADVRESTSSDYPENMETPWEPVNFINNDVPGIRLTNPRFTFSPGQYQTYRVRLTAQPQAGLLVRVAIRPNAYCTTAVTRLTFNNSNWNVAQPVRVRALNNRGQRCVVRNVISSTEAPWIGLTAPSAIGIIQ